ncbi:site-specific integrase [Methylotenera versatilis]|uniref:Integrase family protein n=1 Tax=Methylotenera versatilis (strain 301) TaxID=666681 RepID=D7DL86_METV0|nr:site-specific integrase [Methylotenera versatilis]ADI30557.1 integrase family protein [Methylotenera versatilis 301]
MCTHLSKRGSTYYYRRKTPSDLIHIFGKEVMKSLGTKDKKVAESQVRKMGAHYDDLFASALAKLNGSLISTPAIPEPQPLKTKRPRFDDSFDIDDAETYVFLFNKQLRAKREQARLTPSSWQQFNDYLDALIVDGEEYLKTGTHPFDDEPRPMWKIEAELKAATSLRNNTTVPFTDSMFRASKEIVTKVTTPTSPLLSKLVSKWAAEREPAARTVAKMNRVIERFEAIVGKLTIPEIKRVHAVAFKDGLLEAGLTAANTNQYLTELNTLLNYATQQAIIETNPATGIKIRISESARVKRSPFDDSALKAIFNSPIYTSDERPAGGKGEAAYWLPLLALYTGARLDELCQLHLGDIQLESYEDEQENTHQVWVMRITDEGDGQKLKNSGSRRRIPIHQTLIALGFITYVQAQSGLQIFPELKPASAYGSLSGNWSKWFGKYLREKIKVTDTKMVFHSFRHNFKDYARIAGIATEVHNALSGHSSSDAATNYGSDKYPLRPLTEAMNRYKITGLTLPTGSKL